MQGIESLERHCTPDRWTNGGFGGTSCQSSTAIDCPLLQLDLSDPKQVNDFDFPDDAEASNIVVIHNAGNLVCLC
jgi:hypothetical protein